MRYHDYAQWKRRFVSVVRKAGMVTKKSHFAVIPKNGKQKGMREEKA